MVHGLGRVSAERKEDAITAWTMKPAAREDSQRGKAASHHESDGKTSPSRRQLWPPPEVKRLGIAHTHAVQGRIPRWSRASRAGLPRSADRLEGPQRRSGWSHPPRVVHQGQFCRSRDRMTSTANCALWRTSRSSSAWAARMSPDKERASAIRPRARAAASRT